MRRSLVVAVFGFLFLLMPTLYAQRGEFGPHGGNWVFMGEAHVDGVHDHDNIHPDVHGPFRFIQLRVDNAPIEFDHVVVHFDNGASQVLRVREVIPAGGRTRDIDLRGNFRNIRDIELYYSKARLFSRKPMVQVFGRS